MPKKYIALFFVLLLSALIGSLAVWALQVSDIEDTKEILLSRPGCEAVQQLGVDVPANGTCLLKGKITAGAYFKLNGGIRVSQDLVLAWRPVK